MSDNFLCLAFWTIKQLDVVKHDLQCGLEGEVCSPPDTSAIQELKGNFLAVSFSPSLWWLVPAPGVALRHYGVVVYPQTKEPTMGVTTTIGFEFAKCVSACKTDPVGGVIGVQF